MPKKTGLFLMISILSIFAACNALSVQQDTKVVFSYQGLDEHSHVVGQQTIVFDQPSQDLFLELKGMSKGSSKIIQYTDIENLHTDKLIYYYPIALLEEIGLASSIGSVLEISGEKVIIADIISEEGVKKAVLDRNPIETIFPGAYEITILSIQKI